MSPLGEKWLREKNRGHQKKKRVSEGTERGGRRREDKSSETERSEMNAGCRAGEGDDGAIDCH